MEVGVTSMLQYVIGAVAGGAFGFFVLYKLIGCSSGSCPITANPYVSTILGAILGALLAGTIAFPAAGGGSPQTAAPTQTNTAGEASPSPVAEYKKITAKEAKDRIDSGAEIIILDVRTQEEYDAEHIEGAILIPNETITDKKPELLPDLDVEILIYCRSGNRSAQAANKLIAIGYTNVYDFGGIIDWPYGTVVGP